MDNISKRLLQIVKLIDKTSNSIVTDIGSDHCYLLIYLVNKEIISHGYAIENKSEPLILTQKNIEDSKLRNKITVIFNDGIKNLNFKSNTIIIAGLGCYSITKILDGNLEWIKNQKIILCPSDFADAYILRTYLHKRHLYINNEILVNENERFYIIFDVQYQNNYSLESLSDRDIYLGKYLLNPKNLDMKEYFLTQLLSMEKSMHYNNDHQKKVNEIKKIIG